MDKGLKTPKWMLVQKYTKSPKTYLLKPKNLVF